MNLSMNTKTPLSSVAPAKNSIIFTSLVASMMLSLAIASVLPLSTAYASEVTGSLSSGGVQSATSTPSGGSEVSGSFGGGNSNTTSGTGGSGGSGGSTGGGGGSSNGSGTLTGSVSGGTTSGSTGTGSTGSSGSSGTSGFGTGSVLGASTGSQTSSSQTTGGGTVRGTRVAVANVSDDTVTTEFDKTTISTSTEMGTDEQISENSDDSNMNQLAAVGASGLDLGAWYWWLFLLLLLLCYYLYKKYKEDKDRNLRR